MNIKQMLKTSLEAKWRKHQLHVYLSLYIIVVFVILFIVLFSTLPNGYLDLALGLSLVLIGVYSLVFVPYILYSLYRYLTIPSQSESYEVYEVILDKPSTSYLYRGAIYYQVTFVTKENQTITKDTKPLWSNLFFSPINLSDYNNKKIKIAYNKDKDELIVIG